VSLPESTLRAFLARVPTTGHLLDLGCGDGANLARIASIRPDLHLAGVDISTGDLERARQSVPDAELHHAGGDNLPFPDGQFDAITCLEMIEHVPRQLRSDVVAQARRVAKPHARLILSTPHTGAFQWLDAQNMRHRFPRLYRAVASGSKRDREYAGQQEVVWHHHFTCGELEDLLRSRWQLLEVSYPTLLIAPLADLLSFPFHRAGRLDHPIARGMAAMAAWESGHDFGPLLGAGIRIVAGAI